MSAAEESLRFTGLFESELLVELMLRYSRASKTTASANKTSVSSDRNGSKGFGVRCLPASVIRNCCHDRNWSPFSVGRFLLFQDRLQLRSPNLIAGW